MISARREFPVAMNCAPVAKAYINPEHAACKSIAGASSLSLFCTRQAVEGHVKSGVKVPTINRSMSEAETLAAAIARRAASTARSLVDSDSAANRRCLMPVLRSIHPGSNPYRDSSSSFVTMREGTYDPIERIPKPVSLWTRFDRRNDKP